MATCVKNWMSRWAGKYRGPGGRTAAGIATAGMWTPAGSAPNWTPSAPASPITREHRPHPHRPAADRPGRLRVSMAMMVRAGLGLDPWDVLHLGPGPAHPAVAGHRHGTGRRRGADRLDPAAQPAGHRHVANVIVISPSSVDAALAVTAQPGGTVGADHGDAGRVLLNAVATVPTSAPGWGRTPRRADDRTGGPHRPLGPVGPHRHRGHRAHRRLAAGRHRRDRHPGSTPWASVRWCS